MTKLAIWLTLFLAPAVVACNVRIDVAPNEAKTAAAQVSQGSDSQGRPVTSSEPKAEVPPTPEWVDAPPQRVSGEYRFPVRVGPYASPMECETHLPAAVEAAIDEYVDLLIGPEARGRIKVPWSYIEGRLIRGRYAETRLFHLTSTEQREMHTLYVLLGFDQGANQYLRQLWRSAQGMMRLVRLGVLFGAVVWTMAVVWGYLRVDLASGGRYRWPLRALALLLVALPWLGLGFFTLR